MVSIMNFLNTFFIGSVVVSVVLVAMMVYHFRQRINSLETRVSTLLEIVNNIVTKLNVHEMDLTSGTMHMEGIQHYLTPSGGRIIEELGEEEEEESGEEAGEEEEEESGEEEDDIKEMVEGVDYVYARVNTTRHYPDGNLAHDGNEEDTNAESSIVIIEDDATLESDTDDLMLQQFDDDNAAPKSSDSETDLQFPDATVTAELPMEQNIIPTDYEGLTVAELKDLVGQFTPPVPYYYRMRKTELLDVVRANL